MIKTVKKVWGEEMVIANNEKYCGKILTINEGFRCSLHYHKNKHETFYVLQGNPLMEIKGKSIEATVGDIFEIIPNTLHRFSALDGEVKLIEFSTHHEDSDSYREVLSGKITNIKTTCELCKLYNDNEILTKFYFKTTLITVVDCLTCKIPMAVFFEHGREPTEQESKEIERQCCEYFFVAENKEIAFRKTPRRIKNHTHWHIILKKGVKNGD